MLVKWSDQAEPPGVSVCWYCSMFLFTMWTSCWWLMGGGGVGRDRVGPPHCSCHFTLTCWWLMGGGDRVGPPLCSCYFNSQLLMTNRGCGIGWVLLIAHVTSTLNCWWLMGVGWVPSLVMSFQLSTADDLWGGGSSSSHQRSWMQISSKTKLTFIAV